MLRATIIALACALCLIAQIDTGAQLWVRVREHARASAVELPNYTCQETMERSIHAPTGQLEYRERLRLEVLVATGHELFAWPGSKQFTPQPLESWIRAGALGTGSFAAEVHNLVVSSSATVKYAGLENRDGQIRERFDFYAPLVGSKHELSVDGQSAKTAYAGTIWADPESLDLVRMDSRAEEIPPYLDCIAAKESVSYGRQRLGVVDRLIPSTAELIMIRRNGRISRNAATFSKCGHFGATSAVTFDEPAAALAAHVAAPTLKLPPGVPLVLSIERAILLEEAAAGDPIYARLDKAVRSGNVNIPKGARVEGRIRRLEQYLSRPASIRVGLEFFEVDAADRAVAFRARLVGPRATPIVIMQTFDGRGANMSGALGLDIEDEGAETGVGIFRVPGKHHRLERFRMVWETE
jgi:hypothetical protein